MSTQIKKHMTFSSTLFNLIEDKAKKFGVSTFDYIRFLMMQDVKDDIEKIEVIEDEETIKNIGKSLDDYENGRYTILESDKDIRSYVQSLTK
jgi:hypothetical protein